MTSTTGAARPQAPADTSNGRRAVLERLIERWAVCRRFEGQGPLHQRPPKGWSQPSLVSTAPGASEAPPRKHSNLQSVLIDWATLKLPRRRRRHPQHGGACTWSQPDEPTAGADYKTRARQTVLAARLGKARGMVLSTTSWSRTAQKCALPNAHTQDIGVGLLATILKQAHISREEWFRAE